MHARHLCSSCRIAVLIASMLAFPAFGQPSSGSAIVSGPGTATAARVVTASATVTAIDMTTRQVTLRRADGSAFTVIASPDVRNLSQVRVGDTVTLDFYDTLTLDLKKGGTGAPASRTDAAGAARELGQRPGGIATRETVIVADVIAVNPSGQTVSLRGPGGRVVNLPVRDPEQFQRIAVGDQVEATYVEAVALSITPAATPAPAMAPAPAASVPAPWGRWMLGARVVNINPDVSASVSGFDVKEQWTGEFDTTYFFTPNVAVEGSITWAKQDVSFNGTGLGSLKMMPVVFTAQYHFFDVAANPAFANFKPYVGGGFNYTYFYKTDLGSNSGADVNRDSWGGALQAGFDYQFQRNWNFNMDVKYLWISNDVHFKATGGTPSSLDINPWVFGVGIRYRY